MLVASIIIFSLAALSGAILFLIPIILFGGLLSLYIIFYFVPFMRILSAIRRGIKQNTLNPLRGVIPFTVFSCIGIGIPALSTLSTIAADFSALSVSTLFTFAALAGNMIIVVVINQFNKKLKDT